jgi:hypothetical protein
VTAGAAAAAAVTGILPVAALRSSAGTAACAGVDVAHASRGRGTSDSASESAADSEIVITVARDRDDILVLHARSLGRAPRALLAAAAVVAAAATATAAAAAFTAASAAVACLSHMSADSTVAAVSVVAVNASAAAAAASATAASVDTTIAATVAAAGLALRLAAVTTAAVRLGGARARAACSSVGAFTGQWAGTAAMRSGGGGSGGCFAGGLHADQRYGSRGGGAFADAGGHQGVQLAYACRHKGEVDWLHHPLYHLPSVVQGLGRARMRRWRRWPQGCEAVSATQSGHTGIKQEQAP